LPWVLGQDISKVPFRALLRIESPEAVLNVSFGHEDLGIIFSFGKSMYNTSKGVPKLFNVIFWYCFYRVCATNGRIPPCFSCKGKERSKKDQNCFDLWGIAAIRDIFSSASGLSLMESHATSLAWPTYTFSVTYSLKCAMASYDMAKR
jgi:hypothetical protein